MKIVKLENFHADGGWDTYSFLKITTDEGLTHALRIWSCPMNLEKKLKPRAYGVPR